MTGRHDSGRTGRDIISRLRAHYAAAIHRGMHVMDRHHREPMGAPGVRSSYTLANPHAPGVPEDMDAVIRVSNQNLREQLPEFAGPGATAAQELLKGVELAVIRGMQLYADAYVEATTSGLMAPHALPVDPGLVLLASDEVLGEVSDRLREKGLTVEGTEGYFRMRQEERRDRPVERRSAAGRPGFPRAPSGTGSRDWRVRKDRDTVWISRSAGRNGRWSPAYRLTRAQARLLSDLLYSASEEA